MVDGGEESVVAEDSTVLVEVTRDGRVESVHRGRVVLTDPTGAPDLVVGEVVTPVLPRSALKPLQGVAMVEAGYAERGAGLALAVASHDGEPQHIAGVRELLARHRLSEQQLRCPPDWPMNQDALVSWVRTGGEPSAVCSNCSGKHAAMLATCLDNGWPTETYLDPAHPLQQRIRALVAAWTGDQVADPAVDGCGAPAFAVTLGGLARAFSRLTREAETAATPGAHVCAAMREYPELVSGVGREAAQLTREVPGLVCKDGAEGVWAAALPDGRAFTAKFDDGAGRARPPLLAAVLRHWGFDGPAVRRWSNVPVLGGGRPEGEIRASATLRELLKLT